MHGKASYGDAKFTRLHSLATHRETVATCDVDGPNKSNQYSRTPESSKQL
jgi:hypothetical protein